MPEYALGIRATGADGEELETTAIIEAEDPDDAKVKFSEQVSHVQYWEVDVDHIDSD